MVRDYPYVPRFWSEGSGLFEHRWTLTASNAAITSALLAMLSAFALARLIFLVYTASNLLYLHKRIATITDDQCHVLAANFQRPSSLLFSLSNLAYASRLQATRSKVFRVLLVISIFGLAFQATLIYVVGRLFLHTPIPFIEGPCGVPDGNVTTTEQFAILSSHKVSLWQKAAAQFEQCIDNGRITCFGPIGNNFSWDVNVGPASQCWFGTDHCWANSTTIAQRATITSKDFGTLRDSPLSVTYLSECSHINASAFLGNGRIPNPGINGSFTSYLFGTRDDFLTTPIFANATAVVYDEELVLLDTSYRLENVFYPPGGSGSKWIPPEFLKSALDSPFMMSNSTQRANSTLNLLFNHVTGIYSFNPNFDPFFLARVLDNETGYYPPERYIAVMACRDQLQLNIEPSNGSTLPASGNLSVSGTWDDIYSAFMAYAKTQDQKYSDDLEVDLTLYLPAFDPSPLSAALDGLAGNRIRAQATLLDYGNQFGSPQNVSTRSEVTRWFGVIMLNLLYAAQVFTSGSNNDWGFGIREYSDDTWLCNQTLRLTSDFIAVNLSGAILLILIETAIIIISYVLYPTLLYFLKKSIYQDALIAQRLRNVLHLHRIALHEIYGYQFTGTLYDMPKAEKSSSPAPIYGIRTFSVVEVELPQMPVQSNADEEGDTLLPRKNIERHERLRSTSPIPLCATMLSNANEKLTEYSLKSVR